MRPNWLHRASRSASEGPVGHICSRGEFHEAPGGNRESRGNLSEAPGVNRGPPENLSEAPGLLATSASGQGERFYRGDGLARVVFLPGRWPGKGSFASGGDGWAPETGVSPPAI